MEMQLTFDGELVKPAKLPGDKVICSDDVVMRRDDAFEDCRGEYHSTEADRHERDVEIATEVLNDCVKWATEYCTEHPDYAASYYHIVEECQHEWADRIREWLDDNDDDYEDHIDRWDELVKGVFDRMYVDDCEAEQNRSDYGGYSGDGCCLWGFKIEEHEEQIDISCYGELQELHNQGRLDDVLDDVRCDAYISRSRRRIKVNGYYEPVGRETYNPYESEHPTFEIYVMPGGGWDFVVPADRMRELVSEVIEGWKEESRNSIPKDWPVQPDPNGNATCGHCGLSWDDNKVTSMTPAPAGRCPFENFHV